jgi:hypothetical protein
MIGRDPSTEKRETHTYNGQEFEIIYLEKIKGKYGNSQRLYILFKTPHGTWSSDLRVSMELMEKEPTWKDYMCQSALEKYKSKYE